MEIPFYIIVFDVLLVVLFIGIAINVSIIKDSFSSYSYNKCWHSKFYFLISIGEKEKAKKLLLNVILHFIDKKNLIIPAEASKVVVETFGKFLSEVDLKFDGTIFEKIKNK